MLSGSKPLPLCSWYIDSQYQQMSKKTRQEKIQEIIQKCVYHFSHHFLHKLCAFFHLSARATQLYNVTFLRWVREVDDDLKARGKKGYFSLICKQKHVIRKINHASQNTYLRELIPNFLNFLPFLSNDGSMKTLFNDHVLCTLILLLKSWHS